jgi:hypothetical protein
MPPIKLLAFIGYPRSGGTVLTRVLGSLDGVAAVGEVGNLWKHGFVQDRLCSCEKHFHSCPFWRSVLEHMGGVSEQEVRRAVMLHRGFDRAWLFRDSIQSPIRAREAPELEAYLGILEKLYLALAEVSRAKIIVDSTRYLTHARVLTRLEPPFETYLLHLVRDSRAIALSNLTPKPEPGYGVMQRHGPLHTAVQWTGVNVAAAMLGRSYPRHLRLRYEDFARRPRAAVEEIMEFLGEAAGEIPISEQTVRLLPSHIFGNPMRFERGDLRIRLDDRWRDALNARDKALVTTLTIPLLWKWGYLHRGPRR